MNDNTDRVSLKIDLSTGTIQIDAPSGEFESAVDKAKELLGRIPPASALGPRSAPSPGMAPATTNPSGTNAAEGERGRNRTTRTAGGSQGRAGRLGSFEPVDLGFTEAQERELRAFMQDKKPKEQGEQVAVALYKGEQLTERKGFSYNEIYSLLRLSGIRELPKALDVLMPRLVDLQWVVKEGNNFTLKFVGRDFVEHSLGQKEAG